jgi:hypothetical protein
LKTPWKVPQLSEGLAEKCQGKEVNIKAVRETSEGWFEGGYREWIFGDATCFLLGFVALSETQIFCEDFRKRLFIFVDLVRSKAKEFVYLIQLTGYSRRVGEHLMKSKNLNRGIGHFVRARLGVKCPCGYPMA